MDKPKDKHLVLVVEDDNSVAWIIRKILEIQQYDIIQAKDGEEAIRIVQEHEPDIVLLESDMVSMFEIAVCSLAVIKVPDVANKQ